MEEIKEGAASIDNEIIFSKSVKAGRRIYYFDVKKNVRNEMYLTITESKKNGGYLTDTPVSFEKHKIILFQQDLENLTEAFIKSVEFVNSHNKPNHAECDTINEYKNINAEKNDEQDDENSDEFNFDISLEG